MSLANPRGASHWRLLAVLTVAFAATLFAYNWWARACCAPPPYEIPPGGKDHLPPLDGVMPDDFALTVASGNGSVAPPYHYDFEIAVDSAGNGTLHYWPGYGQEAARLVTGRFTVDWTTRQSWWFVARGLRDAPGSRPDREIPDGGASSTITLRIFSEDKLVESWQPSPWSSRSDSLTALVRAAVPDSLWELTRVAQRQLQ